MPLVFRDYQVVVISPGSETTEVQSGLSDSLLPAAYELPTKVYRKGEGKFSSSGIDSDEVRPLEKGRIVEEAAFFYFLKVVYESARAKDAVPPALLLITTIQWNRRQIERLTRYLFEEVGVPALSFLEQGIAVAYAYATPACLVIDVGLDKTEISFVTDFALEPQASRVVLQGGNAINQKLRKLLPDLTDEEVEDLKMSHIVEVLNSADRRAPGDAPEGVVGEEEEGVIDVAAIVSSGRTREILEARERQRKSDAGDDDTALNKDRKQNSFEDRNGKTVTVGNERFEGADDLIEVIVKAVGEGFLLSKAQSNQVLWDNICVAGRGASLSGFRTALLERLESAYLLSRPGAFDPIAGASTKAGTPSSATDAATMNSGFPRQTPDDADFPAQAPSSIRLAKISDHFPEWKTNGWEKAGFLGAQIAAKQIFTAGLDGVFVSVLDYNELGPTAIWDIC